MRPPITSRKHYVQVSLATVLAGATANQTIAFSVLPNLVNLPTEVVEGCVIKAVYVEMWARTGDTAPGTVLMSLIKVPDGQTPTFADMTALDAYNNKKNVLYHTQGLSNDQDADAIPFIRGWYKIPKGKQRMGAGDQLILSISAQALDQQICGFFTYKEYT